MDQDGRRIREHETGGLDYYDFEYDKMRAERKNALVWAQEAALSNKTYFRMDEDDLGPLTSKYEKHQIFSDEVLAIEGFKDFLERGYEKFLKEQRKNPYRVLL